MTCFTLLAFRLNEQKSVCISLQVPPLAFFFSFEFALVTHLDALIRSVSLSIRYYSKARCHYYITERKNNYLMDFLFLFIFCKNGNMSVFHKA